MDTERSLVEGKVCTRCGERKPYSEFSKNRRRVDGHHQYCKECMKVYLQAYRAANAEELREKMRAFYIAHREQRLEKDRHYRVSHRDEIARRKRERRLVDGDRIRAQKRASYHRSGKARVREYKQEWARRHAARLEQKRRQYWQENAERLRAQKRAFYAANQERLRELSREWNAKNPDANRRRARLWHKQNPDGVRAHRHKRRARLAGGGGTYTAAEWQAMCQWFGNVCLACGVSGPLTADHVVPVVHGGSSDIANLQPLCRRCNSRKNASTLDYRDPVRLAAFLAWLETQST